MSPFTADCWCLEFNNLVWEN